MARKLTKADMAERMRVFLVAKELAKKVDGLKVMGTVKGGDVRFMFVKNVAVGEAAFTFNDFSPDTVLNTPDVVLDWANEKAARVEAREA